MNIPWAHEIPEAPAVPQSGSLRQLFQQVSTCLEFTIVEEVYKNLVTTLAEFTRSFNVPVGEHSSKQQSFWWSLQEFGINGIYNIHKVDGLL